jgi:hypothetical protein
MIGNTLIAKLKPTIGIGQRAEDHVDTGFRIPDHGEHAEAKPVNGATSPIEVQHERRDNCLKDKGRSNDPEMNGFAIARKRNGDCEYDDDAKDSDQVTRHGYPPGSVLLLLSAARIPQTQALPSRIPQMTAASASVAA